VLQAVDDSKSELLAQLHILNDFLLSRTFLVGERISLADISVALDLLPAYQHVRLVVVVSLLLTQSNKQRSSQIGRAVK
jgi:glutathione S-transferase